MKIYQLLSFISLFSLTASCSEKDTPVPTNKDEVSVRSTTDTEDVDVVTPNQESYKASSIKDIILDIDRNIINNEQALLEVAKILNRNAIVNKKDLEVEIYEFAEDERNFSLDVISHLDKLLSFKQPTIIQKIKRFSIMIGAEISVSENDTLRVLVPRIFTSLIKKRREREFSSEELRYILNFTKTLKNEHEISKKTPFKSREFNDLMRGLLSKDNISEKFVFIKYAELSSIIRVDSDLFSIFMPVLGGLSLRENASFQENHLFSRILPFLTKHYQEDNFNLIDKEKLDVLIQSAFESAKWSIDLLTSERQGQIGFNKQLINLSNIYYFFDNYVSRSKLIDLNEFISLMDDRFYNVELEMLKKFNSSSNLLNNQALIYQITQIHPLLKNYFLQFFLKNEIPQKQTSLLSDIKTIQNSDDLSSKLMIEIDLSQDTEHSKKVDYIEYMYKLAIEKTVLNWKLKQKVNSEENISSFKKMKEYLLKALEIRGAYDHQEFLGKKIDLNMLDRALDIYSTDYHEYVWESHCENSYKEDCGEYILLPGIHKFKGQLLINKDIIYGHPLSMIHNPENEVILISESVNNLWINNSGIKVNRTLVDGVEEGKVPLQSYSARQTEHYHCSRKFGVQHCSGEDRYEFNFAVTKGNSPDQSNQGVRGTIGGKFIFNSLKVVFGSVFTSFGGEGSRGEQGLKSKLCNTEDIYTPWKGRSGHLGTAGAYTYSRGYAEGRISVALYNVASGKSGNGGQGGNGGSLATSGSEFDISEFNYIFANDGGLGGHPGLAPSCNMDIHDEDKIKYIGSPGIAGKKGVN